MVGRTLSTTLKNLIRTTLGTTLFEQILISRKLCLCIANQYQKNYYLDYVSTLSKLRRNTNYDIHYFCEKAKGVSLAITSLTN